MKREVTMHSSSHTQYTNGEPVVQVHGIASKTEQTSQKIGDEPAVKVSTPDSLKRTQNTLNAEFALRPTQDARFLLLIFLLFWKVDKMYYKKQFTNIELDA